MNKNASIYKLALTGLFIALSYIGTMFNITLYIGVGKTMIHFGNIFCLLGAFVLGGKRGGLAASLGMGAFDLLNGWVPYAPSTIILKFCIAMIAGSTFDRMKEHGRPLFRSVVLSAAAGMLFNIIASPIASYLTNRFIIGSGADAAKIIAAWQSMTVFINAGIAISIATALYMALYPVIIKHQR